MLLRKQSCNFKLKNKNGTEAFNMAKTDETRKAFEHHFMM
jgi:hypothetical protein